MNNEKLKDLITEYKDSEDQDSAIDRILNMVNVSNKNFESLSDKDKRIAIAEDVLAQLKIKKIKAKSGTYVDVDTKSCTCCAVGSLVVSFCSLEKESVSNIKNFSKCKEILSKYFSGKQLSLIEEAFESWNDDFDFDEDISDKKRLKLIMKNIIKNDGEFVAKQFIKDVNKLILKKDSSCWHEECTNVATKRLKLSKEMDALGHRFVHSNHSMPKNINQLCTKHFNSEEYSLQKKIASLIKDI